MRVAEKQEFDKAVVDWINHCRNFDVQISSSSESVRDCDAYRRIVSMGKKTLPFIRQLYDVEPTSVHFDSYGKGEVVVISSGSRRHVQDAPGFMKGLMAFQYGRTVEESNAGFEKMMESSEKEAIADLAFSIVRDHGLVQLVKDVVGDDFVVPEKIKGRVDKIRGYTIQWLDENMGRYS